MITQIESHLAIAAQKSVPFFCWSSCINRYVGWLYNINPQKSQCIRFVHGYMMLLGYGSKHSKPWWTPVFFSHQNAVVNGCPSPNWYVENDTFLNYTCMENVDGIHSGELETIEGRDKTFTCIHRELLFISQGILCFPHWSDLLLTLWQFNGLVNGRIHHFSSATHGPWLP